MHGDFEIDPYKNITFMMIENLDISFVINMYSVKMKSYFQRISSQIPSKKRKEEQ